MSRALRVLLVGVALGCGATPAQDAPVAVGCWLSREMKGTDVRLELDLRADGAFESRVRDAAGVTGSGRGQWRLAGSFLEFEVQATDGKFGDTLKLVRYRVGTDWLVYQKLSHKAHAFAFLGWDRLQRVPCAASTAPTAVNPAD